MEGEEGEVLEGGEGADDHEYEKAPPPPSSEDHDNGDSSLADIGYLYKLDDTGLSVSYLSPLFHTLSVQFLIPLSLSLFPSVFLAPSGSLPPLFLSVSTLRVRPESVKT